MQNLYPGKILLYGEFSIILKNKALAIPLTSQNGKWEIDVKTRNASLFGWLEYLKKLPHAANYNLVHFEEQLNLGLYFESSIPQGYGAGSSGALVAAFYAHFSTSPIENASVTHFYALKKELGILESYFHGNSSGTDPLVSYLKHSLLLANDKIDKIKVPSPPDDLFFFLLDCGIARKTEPLVSTFLHEIQNNKDYAADFENHYVPVVDQTIQEHLDGRFTTLKKQWLELSQLQTHFFKAMIPKNLIEYWHKGNNEGHTHLKLCGAGGGGYLLGLSTLEEKQVSSLYPNFKIIALPFS